MNELFEKLNNEIIKYNPYYNKELLTKAFLYSKKAHENQFRKSGELYVTHPLNVALNLTKIEADEISIISAILHDVLDNKDYKIEDIEKNFGKEVGKIIIGVRKLSDLYYTPDMTKAQVEELKQSLVLVGNDIRIFLVKIADRFHNLETLEFLPKQKRYRIARETEEIYLPIVNFLSIGEFLTQMHDLCFKYTNEKEYKELDKVFGKKYEYHKSKIIEAHNKLEEEFKKIGLKVLSIEGRVKSLYSIYKKIKTKNLDINSIYDVLALRIVTKTVSDAYVALGIVHKIFNVKNNRFKDYISSPKENGYQSIHTTVYDETGEYIEFQIQTQEMSKLNKSGIAAHFIYKGFGVDYKNLPDWMKGILDLQKKTIDTKGFLEKLKEEILISEIKCFDKLGRFILLPKESVLIDYAFNYSLDNGKFFHGAYVNGVYTNDPFYVLKNGDFIKLEKSTHIKVDYKIENFFLLKTKIARDEIKELFKQYSSVKLIELGKIMLDTSLETYSFRHFSFVPNATRKSVIKSLGLNDEEQLYLFIAIGSIELEKVIEKMTHFYNKTDFNKEVSLKIKTKTKDFVNLNNIIKVFYDLDIDLRKIVYADKKNYIYAKLNIESNSKLEEFLHELQRLPNILEIKRIFPLRLKIYYTIYFVSLAIISSIFLLINMLDISKLQRNLFLEYVLFGSTFLMLAIIFFIKYIVKAILPDVLRYKRFWGSLFLLNTFIFSVILWEIFYFGFLLNYIFFFYIILCLLIYFIIFYEFILDKTNKKNKA